MYQKFKCQYPSKNFYTVGPGAISMTEEEINSKKVFIGNLPKYCTSMELFNLFRRYGEILEAVAIPNDAKTQCRGYGFVTFKDIKDTKFVLNHTEPILFDNIKLITNTAKPTNKNKRYLNKNQQNRYNNHNNNYHYNYNHYNNHQHTNHNNHHHNNPKNYLYNHDDSNPGHDNQINNLHDNHNNQLNYKINKMEPESITTEYTDYESLKSNHSHEFDSNGYSGSDYSTSDFPRDSYEFSDHYPNFNFNKSKLNSTLSDPFFEIIKNNEKTQELMKKQKERFIKQYLTRDILQIDVRFTKPFPLDEMLSHFNIQKERKEKT